MIFRLASTAALINRANQCRDSGDSPITPTILFGLKEWLCAAQSAAPRMFKIERRNNNGLYNWSQNETDNLCD